MHGNTGEWQVPLASDVFEARPLVARALAEVWRFLPVWMYLIYACLLLNTQLTNFDPPRADLAHTVVFPVAVFIVFYVVRAHRAPEVGHRGFMLAVTVGLALGLPLLNVSYHRPSPLSIETLRVVYELSNFVWAGLLLLHAYRRHKSHAVLLFGAGLFYGACLENGGIWLGYFHEAHLDLTVVPPLLAPAATMVGWCVVLYMAMFLVWRLREWLPTLRRSAALSALAVGGVAVLLDLQIDPLATAAGCWVWNETLPGWFHGVPLVNFVAWVCALSAFAYFTFRVQTLERLRDGGPWTGRALRFMFLAVPAILGLAAVLFLAGIGLLEGFSGPSWAVLFRFADQLALPLPWGEGGG